MPMPVQIIESKKLSARENMWLRNLREPADAESFAEMLRAVQRRGKEAPLKAYAHVLLAAANFDVMKEVREIATTMELFEVFRDIFGFDEEWEEKVMEQGRKEGRKEGQKEGRKEGQKEGRKEERMKMAKKLLARGVDPAIIAESSGLTPDKIQKIAAKL
jgi:predicted transposase YdaD